MSTVFGCFACKNRVSALDFFHNISRVESLS